VSLNALGRLASSLTRRRDPATLPPPDDHTDWLCTDHTPVADPPIGAQIVPEGEPEHPARCCDGRHGPTCLDGLPAERYPLCGPINPGLPPIRTEGRDHR
jgi:hypothetical protein